MTRECYGCGSKETYWALSSNGKRYQHWYSNKPTNLFLCLNCSYITRKPPHKPRSRLPRGIRKCYACGSGKTFTRGDDYQWWYLNKPTDLVLCLNCGCYILKYKKRKDPNWIDPRTGIPRTDNVKRKVSESKKGVKKSKDFCEKRRVAMTGSKNNSWRGGTTPLQNIIRKDEKNEEWRIEVFRRDNFRCRICQQHRDIDAHHIEKLRILIKKYNIKSLLEAQKCPELWDVKNGITVCKQCHNKLEKMYDYGSVYFRVCLSL